MSQQNGNSLTSTVAFSALLLSIFSTIYILQYLPGVKENAEFYDEEIASLRSSLDKTSVELANLRKLVSLTSSTTPMPAEVLAVQSALNALNNATAGSGPLSSSAAEAKAKLESFLAEVEKVAAENATLLGAAPAAASASPFAVTEAAPAPAAEEAPAAAPAAEEAKEEVKEEAHGDDHSGH